MGTSGSGIRRVTILDIIKRTFPESTVESSKSTGTTDDDELASVRFAPDWPPDLFAVCAFLLERSGTYQNVNPGNAAPTGLPTPSSLTTVTPSLTKEEHDNLITLAEEWHANIRTVPMGVQTLWDSLLRNAEKIPFHARLNIGADIPDWVMSAYKLMIIADEVSADTGYLHNTDGTSSPPTVASLVALMEANWRVIGRKLATNVNADHRTPKPTFSITMRASMDMLAVLPKSRTAQVGATLRTFSKHLALLPPVTRINTVWQRFATAGCDDNEELNLLLIPLPYQIDIDWWEATPIEMDGPIKWGQFKLHQRWLDGLTANQLCSFVNLLTKKSGKKIHGVVFPEYALTTQLHFELTEQLAKTNHDIEFVISGASNNCEDVPGNFALVSNIYWPGGDRSKPANIEHISQSKHHRWRIDPRQNAAYGLTGKLKDDADWWETMALNRRQIYAHAFRNKSSFTVLICEDLARTDPCHETIRSIGPNIVIALLMDNVQIAKRWPAYYSLGLAEDPGSSVLTLTSRGLIQRAQDEKTKQAEVFGTPARPANWSVAMWRDGSSAEVRELHCPPGKDAVVLSIKGKLVPERTYDGRIKNTSIRWEFRTAEAIGLSPEDRKKMPKAPMG